MKVKCVSDNLWYFTSGAEYEVMSEKEGQYLVTNNRGNTELVSSRYFQTVPEDTFEQEQQPKEPEEQQFKAMKFKVGSEEESEMIQKALFEMGYEWASLGKTIQYQTAQFLYCRTVGTMSASMNDIDGVIGKYEEYTLKLVPTIVKKEKEIEYVDVEGYKVPKEALIKFLSENCEKEELCLVN